MVEQQNTQLFNAYIPDDERDAVLDKLLSLTENKVCFDCKSKNPKWASSNIGIFLCYQCTSVHRNFGVHISFVRSLKMDRWKAKELKCMEVGGNKLAQQYFERNGMMQTDGTPNYKAPQLAKYKQDLVRKAEQEILGNAPQQSNTIITSSQNNRTIPSVSKTQETVNPGVVKQMSSLTFATATDNDDIFSGLKPLVKSDDRKSEQQSSTQQFEPKHQPQLISMNSASSQSTGGLFALGKVQEQADVKTLNAKKLDINFDGDDFFNSFQPNTAPSQTVPQLKQANSSKLQEVDDLFEIAPKVQKKHAAPMSSSFNDINNSDLEFEAQQRLRQMGNRKGISSEDVFGKKEQKSDEVVQRYHQLAGAKAISSDMFFGRAEGSGSGEKNNFGEDVEGYIMGRSSLNSNHSYDEVKEAATKIAEKVTEKASQFKEKALDWLSTFAAGQ